MTAVPPASSVPVGSVRNEYGAEALEPLLAAAPGFSAFGRLCAIDVFEWIGDRRAAPLLIEWLQEDDLGVRIFSAGALGRLGAQEAVPYLVDAWAAAKLGGGSPGRHEAVNLRHALSELGARQVVLPSDPTPVGHDASPFDLAWRYSDLPAVLEALRDAGQVVLYWQVWACHGERDCHGEGDCQGTSFGASIELDWSLPWEELVAGAFHQSQAHLSKAQLPTDYHAYSDARVLARRRRYVANMYWPSRKTKSETDYLVTVEWIDRSDI